MRNERYRKNAISVRERHNERKNEVYSNPDVLLAYSRNNVTFKTCEAATYAQQFDRMVEEGVVSTRGLKPDAYVFDELVFDVNTDYFETHGGYEYAKQFYAEVYELAKEIAGGEQYIISAVMHADERNREASDRLGRDVFHYHLHVVYLPVVEKQIRWSKRCKNPALRGTVRETIMQVSHSKKWPMVPMTDEQGQPVLKKNGKPRLVSSYSLLQTQFFEHLPLARRMRSPFSSSTYSFLDFGSHLPCSSIGRIVKRIWAWGLPLPVSWILKSAHIPLETN